MKHNNKLTYKDVIQIKDKLQNTDIPLIRIANELEVSLTTIQDINKGKYHRDIGAGYPYPIRPTESRFLAREFEFEQHKKVSNDDALEIYLRLEQGEKPADLAREYGLSSTIISTGALFERPFFRHVLMYDYEED